MLTIRRDGAGARARIQGPERPPEYVWRHTSRLRESQHRLVVGSVRSSRQHAEEGVADEGRKASQAVPAVRLSPHPGDARRSAAKELGAEVGGRAPLRDEVRQHERVLECHRGAARHVGGHRVSRITDQRDPPPPPRFV
jgi:hypothetical protein